MGLFLWELQELKTTTTRMGYTLVLASALLFGADLALASDGISKADKYFAKADQYQAQGDYLKAAQYRAKGEKYSGLDAATTSTKADRYFEKAAHYDAMGDTAKAAKYRAKAESYERAGEFSSDDLSKSARYAEKAASYAAAGDLDKAQKYAAKALRYADEQGDSKAAKYAAKAERLAREGDTEQAARYADKAYRYAVKYNDNCWPSVEADFSADGYSVEAISTKDLSNVVLLFSDGTTQRYENLNESSQSFTGTAGHTGKILSGIWIKSGCNHSGDGPGYGEFLEHSTRVTGLPVVSITGSPVTIEGHDGVLTEAMFTITLSEMVPLGGLPVSVTLTTRDGSAMAGEDFVPEEAVLVFEPGEITLDYSVLIIGDRFVEEHEENYVVELLDATNALLGESYAEGWIVDDEGDY